ncbi:hypothetical protein F511_34607 [Dorcoceras hygrometricum]|uniref:Uncharacterized protein n=1 Tax=Dorcoceras hygrometricum TaxID=472368 RepID=A0A2Z7B573_9LAMI|nr:hypothetical protein F511_34607 [Dorcoceras hygrometricum]
MLTDYTMEMSSHTSPASRKRSKTISKRRVSARGVQRYHSHFNRSYLPLAIEEDKNGSTRRFDVYSLCNHPVTEPHSSTFVTDSTMNDTMEYKAIETVNLLVNNKTRLHKATNTDKCPEEEEEEEEEALCKKGESGGSNRVLASMAQLLESLVDQSSQGNGQSTRLVWVELFLVSVAPSREFLIASLRIMLRCLAGFTQISRDPFVEIVEQN